MQAYPGPPGHTRRDVAPHRPSSHTVRCAGVVSSPPEHPSSRTSAGAYLKDGQQNELQRPLQRCDRPRRRAVPDRGRRARPARRPRVPPRPTAVRSHGLLWVLAAGARGRHCAAASCASKRDPHAGRLSRSPRPEPRTSLRIGWGLLAGFSFLRFRSDPARALAPARNEAGPRARCEEGPYSSNPSCLMRVRLSSKGSRLVPASRPL